MSKTIHVMSVAAAALAGAVGCGQADKAATNTTSSTSSSTAILSVDVKSRRGNGIVTEVGPDLYELPTVPSGINPPQVTFDWTAHGDGDDVTSSGCTVIANVTGPSGYDETRRSGDCSGSPNSTLDIMIPGTYTISLAVTSPDGGAAVTGTKTFQIIPKGG